MSFKDIPIEKNSQHEVVIDGWSSDGCGVAHVNGYAVFVPFTIVGERWIIKIVKVSSNVIYGKGLKLLNASESRITPACKYFGKCGGCQTAHMTYEKELEYKLNQINDTLNHVGGIDFRINHIVASNSETKYRNKTICAIGCENNRVVYGFYKKRSHDIISIDKCMLQCDEANKINDVIVKWMTDNHIKPYCEETGKGTVRHIFTRKAEYTDDFVLCIVTARGFGDKTNDLVRTITENCPFVTGIVINVNKTRGNTVLAGDFHLLWGEPYIHDSLNGIKFQIAPQAFYQVNPTQAEKLYNKIREYAELTQTETVIDLYCGTGTIGLTLANEAKKVIGVEVVPEAVQNAIQNAKYNDISNITFFCSDASELIDRADSPDVLIVDPPRKGLSGKVIELIVELSPSKLIYVSCNPSTLARDLNILSHFFTIEKGCSFDMFPRTSHVETVVLMSRIQA